MGRAGAMPKRPTTCASKRHPAGAWPAWRAYRPVRPHFELWPLSSTKTRAGSIRRPTVDAEAEDLLPRAESYEANLLLGRYFLCLSDRALLAASRVRLRTIVFPLAKLESTLPQPHSSTGSTLVGRDSGSRGGTGEARATRYSDHVLVFQDSFTLGGNPEVYPAGTYTVETAKEDHELAGHTARVRTSTTLIVPTEKGTRAVEVKAHDLEAAFAADWQRHQLNSPSETPDRGRADHAAPQLSADQLVQEELDKLGIERVPADVFLWNGYRYSNARDAIASALRGKEA